MQGGRYLSSPLSERAIDAYLERTEQSAAEMPDALTAREREILYLAALGKTNAEIARELVISPRTVETHRSNLMRKLGLHGQADLIRYALRKGILPLMPAPEKK
jgi:DNA-binding NarL/FixJ family response regulator